MALTLVIALGSAAVTGCLMTEAATGRDVSNRCSLTARVSLLDSLPSVHEGIRCLDLRFPSGEKASNWRSTHKTFNTPIDLSATPMVEYGLLVTEGPGRDFTTRLTLRSSTGEEFYAVAHIIPTLWQGVIFDMQACPFLDDVASIEIAVMNDCDLPWDDARFMIDGLTAGKALDLDFDIPGSADRLKVNGNAKVRQGDGSVIIDFNEGDAVELTTAGSRNDIYSPRLDLRNTVAISLDNRSTADRLRLSFITDNDTLFNTEKSMTVAMTPRSGMHCLEFNLSGIPAAEGRLHGLRLEPLGGKGTIEIGRISFEREGQAVPQAGHIESCTATTETITIKGSVDETFDCKGAMFEVRHSPLWKSGLPFDSLELIARVPAQREFIIADIPNSRLDGRMSHLSSRFMAALRLADGNTVALGEPFFITNWRDFFDNPYAFDTADEEFPVEAFGAKGDGVSNDNAAIQRAIDKAAAGGGGRVVLRGNPEGKTERQYLATNLELRSGVNLVIQPGAVLRQSPKFAHYKEFPPEYGHDNVIPGVPWTHCMYTNRPLILAKDIERIKITGGGRIRMDDTYSENPLWTHYARTCSDRIHIVPIAVCNTRHVEISDIDIVRCSNYHTIFYRADSVFIGNLKMHEVACLSGDGLSFGNAVTNVRVARCVFESNDDGIVLCSSYKDPRGGVWRVRVDSIDSSVRHIEVFGSYIDSSRGGAGKAIALIPWGSTNPRQDFNEIDDIEVRDCVLRGGHSIGSWPDNPFDGKPFDNSEPDDYAPVKNLRIFDNEYLSLKELNGVVPTTLLTDCGLHGSSDFKNSGFSDRLAYWTTSGEVSSPNPSSATLSDGLIYQGLHLLPGTYVLSWEGDGDIRPYLADADGTRLPVKADNTFDVLLPQTLLVGVEGKNAHISAIKLTIFFTKNS